MEPHLPGLENRFDGCRGDASAERAGPAILRSTLGFRTGLLPACERDHRLVLREAADDQRDQRSRDENQRPPIVDSESLDRQHRLGRKDLNSLWSVAVVAVIAITAFDAVSRDDVSRSLRRGRSLALPSGPTRTQPRYDASP